MTDKQPEALRLADELEESLHDFPEPTTLAARAAAELRRLHTESEMRRAALLDEMQKAALAAGQATAAQQPGAAYAAPQFPAHPEPMVMDWSAIEISVIAQYGRDMYEAGKRQSHGQAPQQSGVGNSGFDHKTAADFLNGKTVSDEAVRKFVAASRWAHDDRASLQATLQSVRDELASREAEIALLKTALMNAEEAAPTTQPAPQQEAQDPCPTCAALARTVMLDQVSFDRKPNCYAIRQITDDEGVEEWEDIRTSPDVAREEANYMMATGRGEIYEVVPLWTTPQPEPQPSPAAQEVE